MFDEIEDAHGCLLKCGQLIFQSGSNEQIAAFTHGMGILAKILQQAGRLLSTSSHHHHHHHRHHHHHHHHWAQAPKTDGSVRQPTALMAMTRSGKGQAYYNLLQLFNFIKVWLAIRSHKTELTSFHHHRPSVFNTFTPTHVSRLG